MSRGGYAPQAALAHRSAKRLQVGSPLGRRRRPGGGEASRRNPMPNDLVQAWNAVVAQLAEDGLDSVCRCARVWRTDGRARRLNRPCDPVQLAMLMAR
jgi:hypothetical protein